MKTNPSIFGPNLLFLGVKLSFLSACLSLPGSTVHASKYGNKKHAKISGRATVFSVGFKNEQF